VDDYDDYLDTSYVCPCHKFGIEKRCVGVNVHLITVHFGPCEENVNSVCELEVYSGRQPMWKRTWDIGLVKVIKGIETRPLC